MDDYHFCPKCASELKKEMHHGRLRSVCPSCGWIYFQDPKVAVAALIANKGSVLLVRRAMEPRRGLWTLPAGFVDAGEDPRLALRRECFEETGRQVRVTDLIDVIYGQEHSRGAHIFIVYRAEVLSGTIRPGDDVDKAAYFPCDRLPGLAFSTTQKILGNPVGKISDGYRGD